MRHLLIDHEFDYLIWCYGQENSFIRKLQNQCLGLPTTTHFGIPSSFDSHVQHGKRGLFVLDDLMQTAGNSTELTNLFCNRVQHDNVSVILLLQNLFYHGKERMTLLRCAHYLVIFRTPLDATIPYHLAHRILPSHRKDFLELFHYATRGAHSYLFIDGHQTTPPFARFRTRIFDHNIQHVLVLSSDSQSIPTSYTHHGQNEIKRSGDEEAAAQAQTSASH